MRTNICPRAALYRKRLQRDCTSTEPKICKSVKVLPTYTKHPCNSFMAIFVNADSVRVVSSYSEFPESQSTKCIVAFLKLNFIFHKNGAIKSAALLTHAVFGQPFVKRFALSYRTVVCLYVCL